MDISQLASISSKPEDKIGPIILSAITLINGLVGDIEMKLEDLIDEIKNTTDSKASITVVNNQIIISTASSNKLYADQLSDRINKKIDRVNNNLSALSIAIKALYLILIATGIYIRTQDIKDIQLQTLPVPTMTPGVTLGMVYMLAKLAAYNVLLKEKMTEYIILLKFQIDENNNTLNTLKEEARNLSVQVKITNEANKGNFISTDAAHMQLRNDILSNNNSNSIPFTSDNGTSYILKIEKYGDKEIIARAYDSFSGQIKEQTAPSYLSTPDQLYSELQSILNLK